MMDFSLLITNQVDSAPLSLPWPTREVVLPGRRTQGILQPVVWTQHGVSGSEPRDRKAQGKADEKNHTFFSHEREQRTTEA